MSQRTPSAWSPIAASVSTVAARRSSLKAFSCTTSGHGGKYGSRPRAYTCPPASRKASGARASSSGVPRTRRAGRSVSQGWSGAT